jgi:hypothetical protein
LIDCDLFLKDQSGADGAVMGKPKAAMAVVPSGEVRVGIYVRRSTDEEHQPYSIEAQDTSLAAYIESQPVGRWPSAPPTTHPARPPTGPA